ncbi:transcriptional regulator, TetR family [Thalassoporum mexicanum PCC 7367]|uniref:TetR/AcrR family transcriptional regulator n=1 Tax=Thalassoporum mexicanum TaxID=3457544 RepID=UPI00029F9815|nr:TetR/AcrR family transcriptional regulator [Pseudanabaena sp. PCC 7367]AFY70572.1 transcriptional regulator, TetR family [Pseudanabaena sp. PCC 7367]
MREKVKSEPDTRGKIINSAQKLFAKKGFDGTTTKDLASAAGVAEGTIFRYFSNKKAILVEVATQGWIKILTDLLTELSGMSGYSSIASMMYRRMTTMHDSMDMMRVCFMEAQFHPELRDRIQSEVVDKMTDIAEVYFEEAIQKGVYRQGLDPKVIARVFVGMFAVAGFSNETMGKDQSPNDLRQMAEGIADIFLHGVLNPKGAKVKEIA